LTHSQQRSEILDLIADFARECQVRSQVRDKIVLLADELLMNAIWDAPVDRSGRPKYHALPRSQPVALEPSEAVTFRYATDGNLIAVSVADRFGRLHRETACRYLLQCFARTGAGMGPQVAEEAGLGLALAFQSISSFIINCAPGTRTEVVGLINLRMGARERATRPRSFHFFSETHTAKSGARRGS
jgi:anti-sigma regulatory factor (Ser/Thr protein kinase)